MSIENKLKVTRLSQLRIDTDLKPDADNTRDIGSSTLRWRNAYLSGIVRFGGGRTEVVGFDAYGYHWIRSVAGSEEDMFMAFIRRGAGDISIKLDARLESSLRPYTDNTYDLGSSTLFWRDAYIKNRLYLGATDTSLYRAGADLLKTDDNFAIGTLTSGSVLFAGSGGLISQDNANLYWDNVNKRLGIGTTSPRNKLDAEGDIGQGTYSTTTGQPRAVYVYGYKGTGAQYGMHLGYANNRWRTRIFAPTGRDIAFGFHNATLTNPVQADWSEKMVIQDTGNVGIGIANPAERLHVIGNIRIDDGYQLKWSDTNLYRSAADVLKTDDSFDALALRIGGTEVLTSGRVLKNIASVSQTLPPTSDNAYDLGTSSLRWRDGYLARNLVVGGYGNLGSLRIGGTEGIDSTRLLKNVSADASIITSGRFPLARMPVGEAGKVLTAQGIGLDPIWADPFVPANTVNVMVEALMYG